MYQKFCLHFDLGFIEYTDLGDDYHIKSMEHHLFKSLLIYLQWYFNLPL